MNAIYTGETIFVPIELYQNAAVWVLSGTESVSFRIRDRAANTIAGPWTVLQATPGSDWANGKIVGIVPGADTTSLAPKANAYNFEVVVNDGSQQRVWETPAFDLLKSASL